MKNWTWRIRLMALSCGAGSLMAFEGCGLSDQQWATVWQSVISASLNTVVTNALTTAAGA